MKKRENRWKGYLLQAFCWLLMLQLLNVSIDPPDHEILHHSFSKHKTEKKVNQIESICEYVAEEMLDTIVPDSDDTDIQKTVNPVVLYCSTPPVQSFEISQPALQHQSYYSPSSTRLYSESLFQPPKKA